MAKRSVLVTMLILAFVAAGCSGDPGPEPTNLTSTTEVVAQPDSGGRMTLGLARAPGILNPAITDDFAVHAASEPIFNGLVAVNSLGAPVAELAESWVVEDSARTYRFKLHEGVRWHDGQPLTSDDVKFSFDEVILKHHPRTAPLLTAAGVSIEAPDPATVVFSFPSPYGVLLQQLSVTEAPILPRHLYGTCADVTTVDGCPANLNPVGTGPFRFASRTEAEVRLVRNQDYFRPDRPYLDEVVHIVIPDPPERTAALRSGRVDWLWETPEPDLSNFNIEASTFGTVRIGRNPGGGNCVATMAFNLAPPTDRPPILLAPRVREALWAATNLFAATPEGGSGGAAVSGQPIYSQIAVGKVHGPVSTPPFDLSRALLLLDKAGWKLEGGHRVARGAASVPDGTPLRLEAHAAGARQVRFAQDFATQWKALGIEVDVHDDGDLLSPRVWRDHQFDLAFVLTCDQVDPVFGLKSQYVSSGIATGPTGNISGYSNPEMDRLWAQVTTETDPGIRKEAFVRIQELATADLPYMWIAEFPTLLSWNGACRGFNFMNAGLMVETATCAPERFVPTTTTTTPTTTGPTPTTTPGANTTTVP